MEKFGTRINVLPNIFLDSNGTFDSEKALNLCGKIAGVCYDKEGFKHLENEPVEKTNRRIDMTLNNGHHSVYDHIGVSLNLQNVTKILAMILNNEHQYTTSEKSARYTPVVRQENSIITSEEESLYNKWIEIFKIEIKNKYGNIYDDGKIQKLAQENARYLVTVFMPTQMIYSTSLRQINYIYSWLKNYYAETTKTFPGDEFSIRLEQSIKEFLEEIEKTGLLIDGVLQNEKSRSISLFGRNLNDMTEYFGNVYSTVYKGSFAQLAQAHRHRTLDYQMNLLEEKEYFIPPIIESNLELVAEWLKDIKSVGKVSPQGELVMISESGTYENFILKCKERLCSAAQLEIMNQTRRTLSKYKEALEQNKHPLAKDIASYSKGARCTFPDYKCPKDCGFAEGKRLIRKI